MSRISFVRLDKLWNYFQKISLSQQMVLFLTISDFTKIEKTMEDQLDSLILEHETAKEKQ